jgi:hypothetical protein
MITIEVLAAAALAASPSAFQRHDVDAFPAGYQVAVADLNGDGRPDIVALSTEAGRVDWYENPTWKRRPIARLDRPIDLAIADFDRDGRPEIAVAAGFYFAEAGRGGQVYWLKARTNLDEPWEMHLIAVDPVVHRLRWADLDGDGRPELIHAPIFGPGSKANLDPKPSHLWAFRPPENLGSGPWSAEKIDESLTVLHGLWAGRLAPGGTRDSLLTASYEGVFRLDREERSRQPPRWRKVHLAGGAQPADQKPGTARGTSEVAPGGFGPGRPFLAAIEPWHGHEVVLYTPDPRGGPWRRRVLDQSLAEGHALVVADFDGDGQDEIVAGWRAAGGGLTLYDPNDAQEPSFVQLPLDRKIAVEGAVAADLNADGRLDIVAIAGRTNNLVWYENRTTKAGSTAGDRPPK